MKARKAPVTYAEFPERQFGLFVGEHIGGGGGIVAREEPLAYDRLFQARELVPARLLQRPAGMQILRRHRLVAHRTGTVVCLEQEIVARDPAAGVQPGEPAVDVALRIEIGERTQQPPAARRVREVELGSAHARIAAPQAPRGLMHVKTPQRHAQRIAAVLDGALYEQLDRLRRAQGALLDGFGLGPREASWREIFRATGVVLRRYEGEGAGPALFIVPAPIKRPYIWDLAPEVSAVRRCLEAGARVHLLDWQSAPPAFGLAEYASRLVLECLEAAGAARALFVAHSLGGFFAAVFAALHPERVQGLVLLAAPLAFGERTPVLRAMAEKLGADEVPESLPGSFLGIASLAAAPGPFGAERLLDAALCAADPARLRTLLQVERWALDEFALPRTLVRELAGAVVREDAFLRGTLEVAGRVAAAARLRAPLLAVLDPRCPLVPPAAVLPAVEAAASPDRTVLHYEGDTGVALQHVGPLVGRSAHAKLWPRICSWIARTGAHEV